MLSINTQYIVNDKGEKNAVVLPMSDWEKVLQALEEYADIIAYDKAKAKKSDPLDWIAVKKN